MFCSAIKRFLSHPIISIQWHIKKILDEINLLCCKTFFRKKIILLESHFPFDGNSGALFNYLINNRARNSYIYVWNVRRYKDGSIKNKYPVYVFSIANNSFLKQFFVNNASFSFFDDVPVRACGPNAKNIYLAHSTYPLKNVKGIVNVPSFVDYWICSSENCVDRICDQRNLDASKRIICSQLRNDILFNEKINIDNLVDTSNFNKMILWLPTFRKANWAERCDTKQELPLGIPFFKNVSEIQSVNDVLKKNNILLVIKLHPVQDLHVIKIPKLSNIICVSHKDLAENHLSTNMLYPHADALITDYSSAAFDYMLLDRPLGYIVDDFDDYKLTSSFEEYNRLTPGTKINTLDDFINFIIDIHSGVDYFKEERERLTDYLYEYKDGNNCKRLVEIFGL